MSAGPRVVDSEVDRYLGVVAAAALLVGTMAVATDAMAAGHGGALHEYLQWFDQFRAGRQAVSDVWGLARRVRERC